MADLRPFFSFYGGKWRDAVKHYPEPTHATICEPFAGSAGYSMRYPDRDVILCDLDEKVVGVWQYLIGVNPAEIRSIPDLRGCETVDDLGLCQEAAWLVGFWLNRGASRPRQSPSKWMRDGIRPGSFWGERVRETVASQVDSIRHWQAHHVSYEAAPVVGPATWFIDPPYRDAGKHYHHGSDGINYERLGDWCRGRLGQVMVCEAAGADWLPFESLGEIKTTRAGVRSGEALWTSKVIA